MPRACTICQHPERAAIEAALVRATPTTHIAAAFRVSHDAVSRHSAKHLVDTLTRASQAVAAVQAQQAADALDVMAELRRVFAHANRVLDACDRWLRDPDDPTRYDVGPRAGDVLVIYEEASEDGKLRQRKAPLDTLLGRLVDGGLKPVGYEVKHADPRELVLKAVAQLRPSIELLAQLAGELDARAQVNLVLSPEWLDLRGALLAALAPYPEARAAAAGHLVVLEGGARARH